LLLPISFLIRIATPLRPLQTISPSPKGAVIARAMPEAISNDKNVVLNVGKRLNIEKKKRKNLIVNNKI